MFLLGIVFYSFVPPCIGRSCCRFTGFGNIPYIRRRNRLLLPLPMMSDAGRILLSISILALALVTSVGMIYYTMFVNQLFRAYRHWHKNIMTGRISPALSTTPSLSGKRKRRLRTVHADSAADIYHCFYNRHL